MNHYFTLVKSFLKNSLRRKTGNKKLNVGMLVGYILLGIMFAAFLAGICTMLVLGAPFIVELDAVAAVTFMILLIGTAMTLIFGTVTTLNFIYFGKDAQFLSALPVKPGTVFAAKFTVVYLYEFVTSAIVIFFPMLTLAIATGAGFLYYLGILFALVLVPLIPMILAAVIAIPLLYISSYFKHRGAASSIMMLVVFAAAMTVYFYGILRIQKGIGGEETDIIAMLIGFRDGIMSVANYFLPIYAIASFAASAPIFGLSGAAATGVSFVTMIGLAAILTVLTVLLANAMYQRSISLQQENRKASGAKGEFINNSALKSLMKKEWKYLLRVPSFGMQCLLGVIMAPLFVIIFSFMGITGDIGEEAGEMANSLMEVLPYLSTWLFILMFGGGMNVTACTAISREGGGIAMLKSLPVSPQTIVSAKLRVAMMLSFVSAVLGIVMALILQPPTWQMIPFAIVLGLLIYVNSAFSLKADIKHPKLDWTTPVEAVKRNKNATIPSLVAMFASMFGGSLLLVGVFFLPIMVPSGWIYSLIIWAVVIGALVGFAFLAHRRLYDRLESWFALMN